MPALINELITLYKPWCQLGKFNLFMEKYK